MARENSIIFIAGAAVGALTAWLGLKQFYEKRYQLEAASLRKIFDEEYKPEKKADDTPNNDISKHESSDISVKDYAAMLSKEGYIDYSNQDKEEKKEEMKKTSKPYIISPDDFKTDEDDEDYTHITLTYYAGDDILADDKDEMVEDLPNTVGRDFASHFGEYEDDSVYVCNDRLSCKYEITKDKRSYRDVVGIPGI